MALALAGPLDRGALTAAYTTGSATLLGWIASLEHAVGGPLPRTPVREDSGS